MFSVWYLWPIPISKGGPPRGLTFWSGLATDSTTCMLYQALAWHDPLLTAQSEEAGHWAHCDLPLPLPLSPYLFLWLSQREAFALILWIFENFVQETKQNLCVGCQGWVFLQTFNTAALFFEWNHVSKTIQVEWWLENVIKSARLKCAKMGKTINLCLQISLHVLVWNPHLQCKSFGDFARYVAQDYI